jgi:tRNA A-37 threonylcarbamoyl transferase component Bud32
MSDATPAAFGAAEGPSARIDAALATGLRRRPSGEPPPLPKHLDRATIVWLGLAALVSFAWIVLAANATTARAIGIAENQFAASLADARPGSLDDLLASLNNILDGWFVPVIGWGTIALCVLNKRWRHVVVLLIALLVTVVVVSVAADLIQRPRPLGVVILGTWSGWSMPTSTVAMATAALVSAYCCAVPPGRPRRAMVIVSVAFLALYGVLEVLIAQAHPTDIVMAVTLGGAIPLLLFRWITPEDTFPIGTKRGGNSAHLDISGQRGDAIRTAVESQLGVHVLEAKPIGGEGSAGSTPIRLKIADDAGEPAGALFAKLLARSHLRSDRQYKLMRTLAYGRLEDESRFQTVRRLVQQEDYLGLRFAAAGIKVPKTYGIVEITPEAEYLLVTDFLDGYQEIGDAQIDEALIDDALGIVRRMWDAGLAHRDVKPANLMTNGEDVAVIDVGFSQVRPTPWRQAIDLANMMMVLALRSDAETVYQRALLQFSPDDIAEGFAATHGITVPTQLRDKMKEDGRDLVSEFRALAPDRPPISIQRWSARRVGLALGVLLGGIALLWLFIANLQAIGLLP